MRYTIKPGTWSEEDRVTLGVDSECGSVTVTIEVGDLIDEHEVTWREGAYRVRSVCAQSGKSYERTRTWRGETAWMDAQREFDDRVLALRSKGSAW